MEISVSAQFLSFSYALLFGAVTGILYDVFRIVRVAFPIGKAAVFLEDIIFLVSAGILNFVFMLEFNSGIIRIFILLGTLLGFYIYYNTVGRLVIGSAKFIIKIIKGILSFIFGLIFIPLKKICSILLKFLKKILIFLKNLQKKLSKHFKFIKKKYIIYLSNFKKRGGKNGGKKKQNSTYGNVLRYNSHFDHFNDGFR